MGAIRRHDAAVRRPIGLTAAARVAAVGAVAVGFAGCSLVAQPEPPTVHGGSLAVAGSFGYVVCPDAVTPIELATGTPEDDIPLHLSGTPAPGDFAIATSPDGTRAYVVTTDGVSAAPTPGSSTPVTTGAATTVPPVTGQNVVVPIDLETQRAGAPIDIPGTGLTHAIAVLPDGTVLAASGDTVVPVDPTTRRVGTPIDLGANHAVYGLVLNPSGTLAYALVAGGVIPVDTVHSTAGAPVATGLAVSSVYSPHGIAVTADGSTVYVIGQGGTDYGGRVLPIDAVNGALEPEASFDKYGIAAPAAVAVAPDGSALDVVDSANNWVNPLPVTAFAAPPPPVRLPVAATGGAVHPTDIVMGPGGTTAYVVQGFDSVLPYTRATQAFGHPIPVCTGASSMTVAPSPGTASPSS